MSKYILIPFLVPSSNSGSQTVLSPSVYSFVCDPYKAEKHNSSKWALFKLPLSCAHTSHHVSITTSIITLLLPSLCHLGSQPLPGSSAGSAPPSPGRSWTSWRRCSPRPATRTSSWGRRWPSRSTCRSHVCRYRRRRLQPWWCWWHDDTSCRLRLHSNVWCITSDIWVPLVMSLLCTSLTTCWHVFRRLCFSRFGLRTAVPSAASSSSRAVASPSHALPRRRPLRCRRPTPLVLSPTSRAPTAPLASQGPAWPPAPAVETQPCPSGARPCHPCLTPWLLPQPSACSGPHLTPWAMASHRLTPKATPAPPPTSLAWTAVPTCPPCTRSCRAPGALSAPSPCPRWGAP